MKKKNNVSSNMKFKHLCENTELGIWNFFLELIECMILLIQIILIIGSFHFYLSNQVYFTCLILFFFSKKPILCTLKNFIFCSFICFTLQFSYFFNHCSIGTSFSSDKNIILKVLTYIRYFSLSQISFNCHSFEELDHFTMCWLPHLSLQLYV